MLSLLSLTVPQEDWLDVKEAFANNAAETILKFAPFTNIRTMQSVT